jgi:DNA-binding response OmpR family regulator
MAKTILVVDDEPKILDVVKSYLEKAGYQAFCAMNGREALGLFAQLSPSLVVLDLMLPDISGEDVCREIRKSANTPIIMLTAKIGDADIIGGLGLGADDYLTKPFSPGQLVARVEAVLRRARDADAPPGEALSFSNGALVIDSRRREVLKNGEPVPLTPNEFDILYTMARHPLRAYTREALIEHALGDDFDGYDRVIDTHIKNLRQKLEKQPRSPEYILTVHGIGYKFGVK